MLNYFFKPLMLPLNQPLLSVGVPTVNMLHPGKTSADSGQRVQLVQRSSLKRSLFHGKRPPNQWTNFIIWLSFPACLFHCCISKTLPRVTPPFNPLPVTLLSFLSVVNPFLFPPHPPLLLLLFCLQVGWQRLLALRGAQVEELCLPLSSLFFLPVNSPGVILCPPVVSASPGLSSTSPTPTPPPPPTPSLSLCGWGHCGACFNHTWLFWPAALSHLCDVVFLCGVARTRDLNEPYHFLQAAEKEANI